AWHRSVDWLRTVLARRSADQPWLVVLDDLQWADAATLALLTHVVAEVPRLRLLIVGTVRSTELPEDARKKRSLQYLLGHRACELVELQRLTETDVAHYLAARFGRTESGLSEAVYARSEGNPFFMVELLRPWAH